MVSGTIKPIANDAILWYGTGNDSRLKIVVPRVKIHNGIMTKLKKEFKESDYFPSV